MNGSTEPEIYNPAMNDNRFEDELINIPELLATANDSDLEYLEYTANRPMFSLGNREEVKMQKQMTISEVLNVFLDAKQDSKAEDCPPADTWYARCLCEGSRGNVIRVFPFESQHDARNCVGFKFEV